MKHFIVGSLLLVLLIGASSLAPSETHTYTSEEGRITVDFPAEFKTSEKVEEDYRSVQAQAISGDMVFFVDYTVHQENLSNSQPLIEISVNAFMKKMAATPQKKKTWKVNGVKGSKSFFESEEKKLVGEYRVVIIGQIQYQVAAVGPTDSWDAKKAKKFLKSFKIDK